MYQQTALEDPESKRDPPAHWQLFAKGAGQCEYQGFDTWTDAEKEMWREGKLRCKWGIGQVSIRLPVANTLTYVALVYGYLPFVIPIWWAIWSGVSYMRVGKPQFFPFFGLCIAGSFALVNELVTKQICKRTLPASLTARPPEAVCKHPGMPSGHVMNAFTLMVWVFLEAALDNLVHLEWLVAILLVLGPVPWARVYNKDHTVPQVLASACIASVMGCIAFYIRKTHFPHHPMPWEWYAVSDGVKNPYEPEFT
eukprot:CAMPEP_0198491052 /NCGR_PEP_ID=MMETSP1462-20131121/2540_1 /TAXON_ID=1333877 /ORGANISM="Brandtodinium nutriculum, Strain RCC3387" /LENGTH=252 /DNA_ID=CAMNT_0044219637 /DNA_START=64 /DNA_END=822 /DNA_ORIENTATION=+